MLFLVDVFWVLIYEGDIKVYNKSWKKYLIDFFNR